MAAGMTQAEIAEAVGITQPYVSRLVNGHVASVSWRIGGALIRLAHDCESRHLQPPPPSG